MLELLITPTTIIFKNIDDNLYEELKKKYKLYYNKHNEVAVKGTKEELYNTLLNLSFDYDIEII